MYVPEEGLEPSRPDSHRGQRILNTSPMEPKSALSACNRRFPKTVSHMLPKEVDFPAQIGLSTVLRGPFQISVFSSVRDSGERNEAPGVRTE